MSESKKSIEYYLKPKLQSDHPSKNVRINFELHHFLKNTAIMYNTSSTILIENILTEWCLEYKKEVKNQLLQKASEIK